MDLNCITTWLPKLIEAGANVPETIIVLSECNLTSLCDFEIPSGYREFMDRLKMACDRMGYPCFLRTGQTSHKHDWSKSCFVDSPDQLAYHVQNLVEFSEMADFLGLPHHVWAVRKFVPLAHVMTAFNGMPAAYETRFFLRDNKIICEHSYWPEKAFRNLLPKASLSHLAGVFAAFGCLDFYRRWRLEWDSQVGNLVRSEAERLAAKIDGEWSLDLAVSLEKVDRSTRPKVWAIDMAEARRSFHWPDCPNCPPEHRESREQDEPDCFDGSIVQKIVSGNLSTGDRDE